MSTHLSKHTTLFSPMSGMKKKEKILKKDVAITIDSEIGM